ncbi:MAG: ribonuclease J [Mycoplasma sp.]|nr:ribonuclease J [Mycoplasma sp.]
MKTRFWSLGGLQEIGKAALIFEHDNEIIIMDSGIKFADFSSGIQGIIPNYTYLIEKKEKIKALFITHGHEDHIGAIPYLLQEIHVPVIYAPKIGVEYIKARLAERKVKHNTKFIVIEPDMNVSFEHFKVDFWAGQHSIPDAFGIRVKTPNGNFANTGDFRIDYTPIGRETDFNKLEVIGKEGLDVFISDSTNAMRPDHSPTEQGILADIEKFIKEGTKKVFVTAFASNIERAGAIIEMAEKLGKKVCPFGRSMVNGIKIAINAGYIKVKPGTIIDKKQISKFDDNELLILTTGSQGEEMAALSRMARGQHHQVQLQKDDIVIFSSSPIPGNRMKIELLVNQLSKLGVIIKENGVDGRLHTSGHAYKDEHRTIFRKVKAKYFIPFHGEYRMSVAHKQTAVECGIKEENIFLADNGQVFTLDNHKLELTDEVIDVGPIYIDGITASKKTGVVIKEREQLGDSGFVNIIIVINKSKNQIIGRPRIISRGTLFVKAEQELMNEVQKLVHGSTLYTIKNKKNWTIKDINSIIIERIQPLFYKLKRRRPIIIPQIIFIDEERKKEKIINI